MLANMRYSLPWYRQSPRGYSPVLRIVLVRRSREVDPLLAHPLTDKPAQMRDEALLLVGRIGRPNRRNQQVVEVGGVHPVVDDLVDVGQAVGAELVVAIGLEVLVGQAAIRGELVVV